MTDNTALPLTPEELALDAATLDRVPAWSRHVMVSSWPIVRWLATITAKDATIAAQAETIERLMDDNEALRQSVGLWKRAESVAVRDANVAEAEVAALREALTEARRDIVRRVAVFCSTTESAEHEARRLPVIKQIGAVLSPKED